MLHNKTFINNFFYFQSEFSSVIKTFWLCVNPFISWKHKTKCEPALIHVFDDLA